MILAKGYEPGKVISACQAAGLMMIFLLPLVWSFSFNQIIVPNTMTVALVAPLPPPSPVVVQDTPIEKQKTVAAITAIKQKAAIARQREKQRLADEEQERKQKLLEEQQRKVEQEQKRLEDELKQKKLEEKRQEDKRRELLEKQAQAIKLAIKQATIARQARLQAVANQKIMNRYINGIHDLVQRHLANPEGVPQGIVVEIRIRLGPDGRLTTAPETIRSSGHNKFDKQALHAILRSVVNGYPLPKDPELFKEFDELILHIRPKSDN